MKWNRTAPRVGLCQQAASGVGLWLVLFSNLWGSEPEPLDRFEAVTWNADGGWDASNYLLGGRVPDSLTFDLQSQPGHLTIESRDCGDEQSVFIARRELRLQPGDWLALDVTLLAVEPRLTARIGVGLISSLGRAPEQGLRARRGFIGIGLRNDHRLQAHAYGAEGGECADLTAELPGAEPGVFETVLIRRVSATRYELHHARAGEPLVPLGGPIVMPDGASGDDRQVVEEPPAIPGIWLDAGSASFVAQVTGFTRGRTWPIPHRTARRRSEPVPWPQSPPGSDQLTLALPDRLEDLPVLPSRRQIVHRPRGPDEFTSHHSAEITSFRNRLWVAWTATPANEETLPYQGWVSMMGDDNGWSEPQAVFASGDSAWLDHARRKWGLAPDEEAVVNTAPRGWHVVGDRLYLWSLGWVVSRRGRDWLGRVAWTDDGRTWHEIPPGELDDRERAGRFPLRITGSNHGFAPLAGGGWLAATVGETRADGWQRCAPHTSDRTGLDGWDGGWIDTRLAANVGEPNCWQGRDGVYHFTARSTGSRVWHAFSRDAGHTWSRLAAQPRFTDNPGNKQFGRFSDGSIWYVGTPAPGSRRVPLVFAVSSDGWTFDRVWQVRNEPVTPVWPDPRKTERPGYEYPTAVISGDTLIVAYSVARDWIEVSHIPLNTLPP